MAEMLEGRSVAEAEQLMGGFLHLVKGEMPKRSAKTTASGLKVMAGVSAFPMRVNARLWLGMR